MWYYSFDTGSAILNITMKQLSSHYCMVTDSVHEAKDWVGMHCCRIQY